MSALWRQSLTRIQRQFESASGSPIACVLYDKANFDHSSDPSTFPPERNLTQGTANFIGGGADYGDRKQILDSLADLQANGGDQLYGYRHQVLTCYVVGQPAWDYRTVCNDAGMLLPSLPAGYTQFVSPIVMKIDNPMIGWLTALFCIAWRKLPGIPLVAEKQVWLNGGYPCSMTLETLQKIHAGPTVADEIEAVKLARMALDPPARWYSTLDDVARASVAAIDVLLMLPDDANADDGNAIGSGRLVGGDGGNGRSDGNSIAMQQPAGAGKLVAEPPFDATAYLPASEIIAKHAEGVEGLTYKRLQGILDGNREIRTHKPSKNRLLIHLVDWLNHVKQQTESTGDPFDKLDKYADGIEARKAAIREQKQRGK